MRPYQVREAQNSALKSMIDALTELNYYADIAQANGWAVDFSVSEGISYNVNLTIKRNEWMDGAETAAQADG